MRLIFQHTNKMRNFILQRMTKKNNNLTNNEFLFGHNELIY